VIRITHAMVRGRRAGQARQRRGLLLRAAAAALAPAAVGGAVAGGVLLWAAEGSWGWGLALAAAAAWLVGTFAAVVAWKRAERSALPEDVSRTDWARRLSAAAALAVGMVMALIGGVADAVTGGLYTPLWTAPPPVALALAVRRLTAGRFVPRRGPAAPPSAPAPSAPPPAPALNGAAVQTRNGVTIHPAARKCPACTGPLRPGADRTVCCSGPGRHEVHDDCARKLMRGICPLCKHRF
jgi:hypothetical protein